MVQPDQEPETDTDLPHLVLNRGAQAAPHSRPPRRRRAALTIACLFSLVLVAGLTAGQEHLFGAEPTEKSVDAPAASPAAIDRIVALGRLLPEHDVVALGAHSLAGNARIAELHVQEGDELATGTVIATLDIAADLNAAYDQAEANHAAAVASLHRITAETRAALAAARAELAAARVLAKNTAAELQRAEVLRKRRVISQQVLDRDRTADLQARRQVDIAQAHLSRFLNTPAEQQPDVILARQQVAVADADRRRALQRLDQGQIVSPGPGRVLQVLARAGERVNAGGAVVEMANISTMTAELEVHQNQARRIQPDARVRILADALGPPASGRVIRIRQIVERQTAVSDNPAAHTDARIIRVRVLLNRADIDRAARLIGLQVRGEIDIAAAEGPAS